MSCFSNARLRLNGITLLIARIKIAKQKKGLLLVLWCETVRRGKKTAGVCFWMKVVIVYHDRSFSGKWSVFLEESRRALSQWINSGGFCHTSFWPELTWQASLKGSQIQGIWEYWTAFGAVLGSSLSDEMFSGSTWSIHAAATIIHKFGVASCVLSELILCRGCCLFTNEMQCCWRFSAAISIGSEGDVWYGDLLRPYFCSVW